MSSVVHLQSSRFTAAAASGANLRAAVWFARCMSALIVAVDFLERAAAGRRALRQLAEADDRMLKDIGLDRSDLRNANAEPLFSDPTELLAGRVREGRTHVARRLPGAGRAKARTPSRYY